MRYLAAHRLHQAGHEGWEMGRKLRNSGMELRRGPVVMRVLKAQYGGPPHPGASLSRRGFYRQQLIPLPLDWEKVDVTEGAFLLIDWSMGEKREVLLGLSTPAGVWNFQGQPKTEWHMPVEFDSGGDPKFPTTLDEELYVTPIFELDDEEISGPGSAA